MAETEEKTKPEWLTKQQIDSVLDNLTGQDVLEAVTGDEKVTAGSTAGKAFDAAAKRLGVTNGTAAMLQVKPVDALHLAQRMGELLNVDSPKAKARRGSQGSATTGE